VFEFIEDEELRQQAIDQYEASIKETTESIDTKIEEAVAGLKAKNEELLGEKKSIQEKLAQFSKITDPGKAIEALEFLQENEDAQLIKEGKVDELVEKRVSNLRLEHEKQVDQLRQQLEEIVHAKEHYESQFKTKIMDDAMREIAVKAGIRAEAISDVLMRSKQVFSLAEDGTLEARGSDGKLLKNDKGNVVTPIVWLEGLKESAPHYWPSSEGVGATGGSINSDADLTEKLAEFARKGDMKGYRTLRDKMKSA
jgi:hypothetical protein